jgi:hypothetical protein
MPVEKKVKCLEDISVESKKTEKKMKHTLLFNFKRVLQCQIIDYLSPKIDTGSFYFVNLAP